MRKTDVDLFVEYRFSRGDTTPTSGSIQLRNQLVARNLELAYTVSNRFYQNQSKHDWEDFQQVALVGLIKAVEGFDCHRGVSFSAYAVPLIRGELQHYLRDKVCLLGGSRSIEGLLKRHKITKVDADKLNSRLQNILWLGRQAHAHDENPLTLEDTLVGEVSESSEGELIESLYQEIERLPEPLGAVSRLRAESLDLKQIAQKLGIAQMTVSRRLSRACKRLKKQLV